MDIIDTVPTDVWNEIFNYGHVFEWSQICIVLRKLALCRKIVVTRHNFGSLCARGDIQSVIAYSYPKIVLNRGLYVASLHGHYKLAMMFHNRGAIDLNKGLMGACKGGHIEIANYFIRHGATDYLRGFNSACEGGKLELAKLMVDNGCCHFMAGMTRACKYGHLELAMYCWNRNVSDKRSGLRFEPCMEMTKYYLNDAIFYACRRNHQEILRFFVIRYKRHQGKHCSCRACLSRYCGTCRQHITKHQI